MKIAWLLFPLLAFAQNYDLVITKGRVMDPESGLDAVRNIGITQGKVQAITAAPLQGKRVIDASGLVVAPGFIDLHWHGTDPASDKYEAMDGVTASFELEIGTADVDKWYRARASRSMIHHGVSAGHAPIRMEVLGDSGDFLPADKGAFDAVNPEQLTMMKLRMEQELKKGAVGAAFGIVYTPAATYWEILEMFRVAARFQAACHVHLRGASSTIANGENGRMQGLSEVIAAAAITGAPLQVVHINSSGQESVGKMLQMISDARSHGMDITTEAYPYTAGATRIESASFKDWENRPDSDYQKLQWAATGERLTRQTFLKYREQRGVVIIHSNTEENVRAAILSPLTMIASDGFDVREGEGHPRSAGTFSRVLAKYVRDEKSLSLMDALKKMTLMPAQRIEKRVPMMRNKGRLRVGADADITMFDPATVQDMSTYEHPARMSSGIRYVLVNGTPVVDGGAPVNGVFPGTGVRAPQR
jgi:N-acyl-D-aspartate/D-glutamate deacylase